MFNGLYYTFYIIFGTNLLTEGPVQVTEYQMESKRNETFARIVFGTNAIQETWSGRQGSNKAAMR